MSLHRELWALDGTEAVKKVIPVLLARTVVSITGAIDGVTAAEEFDDPLSTDFPPFVTTFPADLRAALVDSYGEWSEREVNLIKAGAALATYALLLWDREMHD